MKKFDPRNEHKVDYTRFGNTVYCSFDPNLTISGKKMRFIVNSEADPESLLSVNLSEDKMKKEISKKVTHDLEKIELSGVNGLCKLFLYQHFLVSRLSWVFLVHDLSVSFAKELDRKVIPRLKAWAGLFRSSDLGALFRRRENLGLQLTILTHCYMHMQVVKLALLKDSSDVLIRDIYQIRKDRVSHFSARWSGPFNHERSISHQVCSECTDQLC